MYTKFRIGIENYLNIQNYLFLNKQATVIN